MKTGGALCGETVLVGLLSRKSAKNQKKYLVDNLLNEKCGSVLV